VRRRSNEVGTWFRSNLQNGIGGIEIERKPISWRRLHPRSVRRSTAVAPRPGSQAFAPVGREELISVGALLRSNYALAHATVKDEVSPTAALQTTINKIDGTTGAFISVFVRDGTGGMQHAVGLAFGPDSNLYVGGALSHNFVRFDTKAAAGESCGSPAAG
jgi:hypothetical protein